jgi:hypothetical protein
MRLGNGVALEPILDRLLKLMHDPERGVRHAAAEALERMAGDGVYVIRGKGRKFTIKRLAASA